MRMCPKAQLNFQLPVYTSVLLRTKIQLHRHCYRNRVEVAGWWGRGLSFHTCSWLMTTGPPQAFALHSSAGYITELCSIPGESMQKEYQKIPRSGASIKTFMAYCATGSAMPSTGLLILGVGFLSRSLEGLMVPTFNPNMVFVYEAWRLWSTLGTQ